MFHRKNDTTAALLRALLAEVRALHREVASLRRESLRVNSSAAVNAAAKRPRRDRAV